jgi:hypothetical protein
MPQVVDMTRMQYGKAAMGPFGETYFLGTLREFKTSMAKICASLTDLSHGQIYLGTRGTQNEQWLTGVAAEVFRRWQNRVQEGWCDYCGKPDTKDSMDHCGNCKKVK